MIKVLWQVSSVLAGTALLMIGSSLLGILLPLHMARSGFSTETTGFVMASYYAGLMLGALYGLRIIIMAGHIRAFAGFAALVSAVVLLHPLYITPWAWVVLRLLVGFCLAGLFAVMESWLNERSNNETRGRVLGVYLMTQYISLTCGQMLVNVWQVWQLEPYMIAAILVSLSLVPVVLTRESAPDLSRVQPLRLLELLRISPLSVMGTFCSGLLMGGFFGMGAIYAKAIQFDTFGVSIFLSGLVVGGFLLQFPIGRASDVFDRRTVMAVVLCFGAALSVIGMLLPQVSLNFWVFAVLAALIGGPFTAVYPLAIGQAFDYLPKERYVAASGGLLLSYSMGATAGPIITSFAMANIGSFAFFGFFALVTVLLLGFVIYRMRVRTPLPPREQEVYQNVPAISPSPVAAELDPRAVPPAPPADAAR